MTTKHKTDTELAETFTQFAQKCTICTQWLIGDDEIATDPSHPWQIVHKDCIYLNDIASDIASDFDIDSVSDIDSASDIASASDANQPLIISEKSFLDTKKRKWSKSDDVLIPNKNQKK
jgi:hypothetical protein